MNLLKAKTNEVCIFIKNFEPGEDSFVLDGTRGMCFKNATRVKNINLDEIMKKLLEIIATWDKEEIITTDYTININIQVEIGGKTTNYDFKNELPNNYPVFQSVLNDISNHLRRY